MAQKPSIPKGTRDFGSEEVGKRQYIMGKIQAAFQRFGFLPIETPSFENVETLTGKYGDEGDQLIFRILRSGDFTSKAKEADWNNKNAAALAGQIADKAMRYDLTVPFARYVVQHQNELAFPFKRYQIQPVWRADRPQKGRFREFFQCDADVVGSKSLWQEVEFVQLYDDVFSTLNLNVSIRINNRKILAGIADALGIEDRFVEFTIALDKLDKVGVEGVIEELKNRNFPENVIAKLGEILVIKADEKATLSLLAELFVNSKIGAEGLDELKFVREKVAALGLQTATLDFDITLARGLNYYTGAIFEVIAKDVQMGSIGGGGRYDDLTGIFGLKNMSGIGISFGLDRIYLCLEECNLFPTSSLPSVQALFLNFGDEESFHAVKLMQKLRQGGVSTELYPDAAKMKKQFDYAAKKGIQYAVFLGSEEIESSRVNVKNLITGDQNSVDFGDLIAFFSKS